MKKPLLIAHQGGKYWKGKNFSYISEAIKDGADIIELDIRPRGSGFIVQHDKDKGYQGTLQEALKKVKAKSIYLDIKDKRINPNELINFVRQNKKNKIIIGSFNHNILKKVKKSKGIIVNYHCLPLFSIKKAKEVNADWINPIPFFIMKYNIKKIIKNGFKFVPAGSENYKKQLKYAKLGAYAISIHDIKRFKKMIQYATTI